MTKSELLELIANGENSGTEFKSDDLRPEQIAKEAVALANFRGGRILLGVEDDGAVTGIRRDDLERWVMDTVFGRKVHPMIDESMRRKQLWHYPVTALREGVVNALAHRDWTRHEEVEVACYSQSLEVLSPGALKNTMTVEKMIAGQRSARNSLIVEVLRDYGYVDARGRGVRDKIIPLLRHRNGTDPEFEATEDYLRLTMRRGGSPAE